MAVFDLRATINKPLLEDVPRIKKTETTFKASEHIISQLLCVCVH